MKHVLFIHYFFLPVHNVAVKRLVGYARHLPAFGWRALALTRQWRSVDEADPSWGLTWEPDLERESGCMIYRVAEPAPSRQRRTRRTMASATRRDASADSGAKVTHISKATAKVARLSRMLLEGFPDEFTGWVGPAVREGLRVARHERVDVVMSYCPPVTNHLVGRRLARRLGVPWVAFFGDLYGFLEPPLPTVSMEGFVKRRWYEWCLAPAAACAAVSPAMVEYLARRYRKPTELVHTGFDVDGAPDPRDHESAPRERFVVSHVGSVYPGDQRPEVFFDGLDELLARRPEIGPRLEVRFVGSKCDDQLRTMLDGRPAASVCSIEPVVDSVTAASVVQGSDVLLAFTCTLYRDRFGTLSYPTKVFEAFGARKPVLAVPADGDWVDELLTATGGGRSARNAGDVAAQLSEWYSCWAREGAVPHEGRPEVLASFSRRSQADRLSTLFETVRLR